MLGDYSEESLADLSQPAVGDRLSLPHQAALHCRPDESKMFDTILWAGLTSAGSCLPTEPRWRVAESSCPLCKIKIGKS